MFGERSLEISRPARPRRAAARKPVSPVPAASSRIVWPGCGSSRSTSHSRDLARRLLQQVAAAVPARRHLLPELVVGARHGARGYSARSSASSSGEGSHSPARGVRAHLLRRRRAGDHRRDRRLRGESADRDVEQRAGRASAANASSASTGPTSRRRRRAPASRAACPPAPAAPRRYFPVSRPRASGKYGSSPSPSRSQAGISSRSASRSSHEYSFCAETKRVEPALARDVVGLDDLRGREVRASRRSAPCPRGRARPARRASPRSG